MQPKLYLMHNGITDGETELELKPRPTNSTKSRVLSFLPDSLT